MVLPGAAARLYALLFITRVGIPDMEGDIPGGNRRSSHDGTAPPGSRSSLSLFVAIEPGKHSVKIESSLITAVIAVAFIVEMIPAFAQQQLAGRRLSGP
ncbi:MAG: hypothetical protein ACXQTG_00275 [Methanoculleaceae archaeon]